MLFFLLLIALLSCSIVEGSGDKYQYEVHYCSSLEKFLFFTEFYSLNGDGSTITNTNISLCYSKHVNDDDLGEVKKVLRVDFNIYDTNIQSPPSSGCHNRSFNHESDSLTMYITSDSFNNDNENNDISYLSVEINPSNGLFTQTILNTCNTCNCTTIQNISSTCNYILKSFVNQTKVNELTYMWYGYFTLSLDNVKSLTEKNPNNVYKKSHFRANFFRTEKDVLSNNTNTYDYYALVPTNTSQCFDKTSVFSIFKIYEKTGNSDGEVEKTIIAICVGSFFLICGIILYYYYRRNRSRSKTHRKESLIERQYGVN